MLLHEDPIDPKLKKDIEDIIDILKTVKDADYSKIPRGAPYVISSHQGGRWVTSSNDEVTYRVAELKRTTDRLRSLGKTQSELQEIEKLRLEKEKAKEVGLASANIIKDLLIKVQERFPRFIKFLNIEPIALGIAKINYAIVEPSGERLDLAFTSNDNNYRAKLADLLHLFRHPDYKKLQEKVQTLRDFGFNVTGQLLNTDGGTFRTRYSIISDVLFSYKGIGKNGESKEIDGHATIKTIDQTYTVENVKLEHIGEIIDTIDIMIMATNAMKRYNLALLKLINIQLIGNDIVEYVLRLNNVEISIQSSEIRSIPQLTKLLYNKIRSLFGYEDTKTI